MLLVARCFPYILNTHRLIFSNMSVLFSRLWCSNLLYCYQYDDGAHKLSWPLFDRIRAFAANAGVNNQDRVFQDQSEMHRIMAGRAMFGQSYGTPITDPTGLQFGRLQRYTDYDQRMKSAKLISRWISMLMKLVSVILRLSILLLLKPLVKIWEKS